MQSCLYDELSLHMDLVALPFILKDKFFPYIITLLQCGLAYFYTTYQKLLYT